MDSESRARNLCPQRLVKLFPFSSLSLVTTISSSLATEPRHRHLCPDSPHLALSPTAGPSPPPSQETEEARGKERLRELGKHIHTCSRPLSKLGAGSWEFRPVLDPLSPLVT
jgi:hypothetical protein